MSKPHPIQQEQLWPDDCTNRNDAGALTSININETTTGSPETIAAITALQAETNAEIFLQTLLDRGFSPHNAELLHQIYTQNLQGLAPTANSLQIDTTSQPRLEKFATPQGRVNAIVRKIRESLQRGAYPYTILFVTEPTDGKKSTPGFIIAKAEQPEPITQQVADEIQSAVELSPAIEMLAPENTAILSRLLKVAITSYSTDKTRRITQLNCAVAATKNGGSFTAEYYSQHTTPPLPTDRAREDLNKLVREFEDPKRQKEYGFKFIKNGDRYQAIPVGNHKKLIRMLKKEELKKPSKKDAAELEARVTKRIPDILSGREAKHKKLMQRTIAKKIIPNSKKGKWTHYEDTGLNKHTFESIAERVDEINRLNPGMLGFKARAETGPKIAFVLTGSCSKEDTVYTTKNRRAKTLIPEGSQFDKTIFDKLFLAWAITPGIRDSLYGKALRLLFNYTRIGRAVNLASFRKSLGIPDANTNEFHTLKTYIKRILRTNFRDLVQIEEIDGCMYLTTTADKATTTPPDKNIETKQRLSDTIGDSTRHFGGKEHSSIRGILWEMTKLSGSRHQPISAVRQKHLTPRRIWLAMRSVQELSKTWPTLLGFTVEATVSLGRAYYTPAFAKQYIPAPIDYNQNYPPYPLKIKEKFTPLNIATDQAAQYAIQGLIHDLYEKESRGEESYPIVRGLEILYEFSKSEYAIPREIIDAALRVNGAIVNKDKIATDHIMREISKRLSVLGMRVGNYHSRTRFIRTRQDDIPKKFAPSLEHSKIPKMDYETILAGTELANKLIAETRAEVTRRHEERRRKLAAIAMQKPIERHVRPALLQRLSHLDEDLSSFFGDERGEGELNFDD